MNLLKRRNFIAGLGLGAGAHLLGPMFENMLPTALGAVAQKKHYFQVLWGFGLQEARFKHSPRSETDFDLRAVFAPLAPHKKDLVVVEYLRNGGGGGLHSSRNLFVGTDGKGVSEPYGLSIDRYLAAKIGHSDAVSSTNLLHHTGNGPSQHVSADGPGKPYPAEWNPVRAYATLFGGGRMSTGSTEQLLARDKSVLDALTSEVTRMNARLAGPEKAKLQQYLESLRAVERQLGALVTLQTSCMSSAPDVKVSMSGPLSTGSPGESPKGIADFQVTRRFWPELANALVDITALAHVCGLTRVSSLNLATQTGSNSYNMLFPMVGPNALHHHAHHDKEWDTLDKIDAHIASYAHRLVTQLKGVADGGGTMFDNSLVLFGNIGGGHHCAAGGTEPLVFVMLGNAGGAFKTGRLLTLPKTAPRYTNDLCLSIAKAFDVPLETFGDPAKCKGPLPL